MMGVIPIDSLNFVWQKHKSQSSRLHLSNICFWVYDKCVKNENMLIPTSAEPSESRYLFLRMAYDIILVWRKMHGIMFMYRQDWELSTCDGKKPSSVLQTYRKAVVWAITRPPIIDRTLKFVRDEDAP